MKHTLCVFSVLCCLRFDFFPTIKLFSIPSLIISWISVISVCSDPLPVLCLSVSLFSTFSLVHIKQFLLWLGFSLSFCLSSVIVSLPAHRPPPPLLCGPYSKNRQRTLFLSHSSPLMMSAGHKMRPDARAESEGASAGRRKCVSVLVNKYVHMCVCDNERLDFGLLTKNAVKVLWCNLPCENPGKETNLTSLKFICWTSSTLVQDGPCCPYIET